MIVNCGICKKEFYAKPSHIAKGRCKYCSKSCFDIWQRNNKKLGDKSQRWNSIQRICKLCGKEFFKCPAKIALGRGIYCSRECYNKGMVGLNKGRKLSIETRLKISGENHYNWKGGRSLINRKRLKNAEWDTIKKEVFKRDGRICQKCKKFCKWMDISCHHIKPWRISKNDNLDNLITLCRSCHAKEDGFKKLTMNLV